MKLFHFHSIRTNVTVPISNFSFGINEIVHSWHDMITFSQIWLARKMRNKKFYDMSRSDLTGSERPFEPSSFTLFGWPVWHNRTVHYNFSITLKRPSTFSRITVYFDPWPFIWAQMTIRFGSKPSNFWPSTLDKTQSNYKIPLVKIPNNPWTTLVFAQIRLSIASK